MMRLSTDYGSSTSNFLIVRPEKRSKSLRLSGHRFLKVKDFPVNRLRLAFQKIAQLARGMLSKPDGRKSKELKRSFLELLGERSGRGLTPRPFFESRYRRILK
jgi:hypothetical protein